LNKFSRQAGATSMKHVWIAGLGFFLAAVIITLVSLSLNVSNVTFEVALS
jgi:branched-subunit amino acid permease